MQNQYCIKKIAPTAFRFFLGFLVFNTFLLPAPKVYAHPHIFIVQRLNAVFDEKGLAGIKVIWKFDDMFAGMISEDHDINKNGTLETEEVREVKDKAFSYISEFDYFSFIKIDGTPFEVNFITDFNATLEDGKLVYEFTIPCHVTATKQFKKIVVCTYDPTYYTAIFFAANRSVSLTGADTFEITTAVKEDPDTKIYYDMVNPWALFLEFRQKP